MDGSYDEVFAAPGQPRAHASALAGALAELGPDALADAGRMRDSIFMQQGITFDAGGPDADGPVRDRPFPLDLVPRIIPGEEWRRIKRGLAQRIRALNAFVDDVYHGREIVHEGIVPWELVVSRSAFARAAHGIRPPGGVYCHVSGCDLVRDADGSWKVLEDNVRTPSGISYVLENRVAMTRLLPGLFGSYRVRPVGATRAATPAATLQAVAELIPERFEYRTGVTYVGSTVEDLLDAGAGVCQDFAHLALLLLRRHGLAARYVSGYLFAPDGDSSDSAEVDTHAWVEALLPTGDGAEPAWVAADPTNRKLAGEDHVKIGHGRHYSDVPPIKGVYRGGATAELDASVRMTRIDNSRTAPAA